MKKTICALLVAASIAPALAAEKIDQKVYSVVVMADGCKGAQESLPGAIHIDRIPSAQGEIVHHFSLCDGINGALMVEGRDSAAGLAVSLQRRESIYLPRFVTGIGVDLMQTKVKRKIFRVGLSGADAPLLPQPIDFAGHRIYATLKEAGQD